MIKTDDIPAKVQEPERKRIFAKLTTNFSIFQKSEHEKKILKWLKKEAKNDN